MTHFLTTIQSSQIKNSNKFNDYCVNIGSTLAAQIPTSGPSFKRYLLEANTESIFLSPTDEQEIRKIILDTRDSAPGHDEITSKVIKHIIDILTTPLTYITNVSFTEGVFPSELKIAQVLPLYKSNDPMTNITPSILFEIIWAAHV